jgi:hypothetical protein
MYCNICKYDVVCLCVFRNAPLGALGGGKDIRVGLNSFPLGISGGCLHSRGTSPHFFCRLKLSPAPLANFAKELGGGAVSSLKQRYPTHTTWQPPSSLFFCHHNCILSFIRQPFYPPCLEPLNTAPRKTLADANLSIRRRKTSAGSKDYTTINYGNGEGKGSDDNGNSNGDGDGEGGGGGDRDGEVDGDGDGNGDRDEGDSKGDKGDNKGNNKGDGYEYDGNQGEGGGRDDSKRQ